MSEISDYSITVIMGGLVLIAILIIRYKSWRFYKQLGYMIEEDKQQRAAYRETMNNMLGRSNNKQDTASKRTLDDGQEKPDWLKT